MFYTQEMTKFILHGGFIRADKELNHSFFKELTTAVPNNGAIRYTRNAQTAVRDYRQRHKITFSLISRGSSTKCCVTHMCGTGLSRTLSPYETKRDTGLTTLQSPRF